MPSSVLAPSKLIIVPPNLRLCVYVSAFFGCFQENHAYVCLGPKNRGKSNFVCLFRKSSIEKQKLNRKNS